MSDFLKKVYSTKDESVCVEITEVKGGYKVKLYHEVFNESILKADTLVYKSFMDALDSADTLLEWYEDRYS
jgi:hypothetical protein